MRIGNFEILELVGRGAMGAVYRAVDPAIGRLVAIKVIRLIGYADGEEAAFLKERLWREARAAGGLSHPAIVTVYQLGMEDEQAFIAMEYIDGSTLESRLASRARADPELLFRVVREVAAGLDYAHQRGVVHRDIKPANIMLTHAGEVKITDFGIAKTLLGHTRTETGMILGTPYYMSPEQVRGSALDGRSDQFALAVIAYQMLTGRKPFEAENVTSICYQIVHAEAAMPAEPLQGAVWQVLKRALEKDPARRYPTCAEFAAALVASCARTARVPVICTASVTRRPAVSRRGIVCGAMAAIAAGAWGLRSRQAGAAAPAAAASPPDSQPSSGRILWTGLAKRGTLLRFENGHVSAGKVYGRLPGGPVEVRIFPAERSSRRLTVFTTDEKYAEPVEEATAAGPALFSWDPRHIMDATVLEAPGEPNHWGTLVLRVNSAQLAACVIEWIERRQS